MDAKNLFLAQHAAVQSAAVGGNPASAAERAFAGLSDEQMRVRDQVCDDAWRKGLGVSRRDFGIGMTSTEVTELTRQVDLAALREYRDAVGRRTREIVGNFGDEDWGGEIAAPSLQKAATEGAFGARAEQMVKAFTGRPRAAVLSGIALFHPAAHLGEAVTVRSAGGFGTGI